MRYYTHVAGSLVFSAGITLITGLYEPTLSNNLATTGASLITFGAYIIGSTNGSLLPDIEKKGSSISNKHKFISFISRIIFTHRGFTHSLDAVVLLSMLLLPVAFLFSGLLGKVAVSFVVGTLIGYFSHIILDAFTPDGVPLLYFLKFRLRIPLNIRTGGLKEWLFFGTLIISLYLMVTSSVLATIPYKEIIDNISLDIFSKF